MSYVPQSLEWLVHWINERERIRIAKESGQRAPWTTDHILAEWRFCNVNRCDDRETRWIFQNIIAAHADSPVLWFNLTIARFVNWSPTLAALGYFDAWDRDRFVAVMAEAVKGKAYTGAYMIPAGPAGTIKHEHLADAVFSCLWDQRANAPAPGSPCSWWDAFLRRAPLVGDFLRNQIITDMKYTHHLPKATTSDWQNFIPAGPGTQRGLNRMHGYPLDRKWTTPAAAAHALQRMREELSKIESLAWAVDVFADLNNLSNCMCEFDKYCRVKLGEGKPRARYAPVGCATTPSTSEGEEQ